MNTIAQHYGNPSIHAHRLVNESGWPLLCEMCWRAEWMEEGQK